MNEINTRNRLSRLEQLDPETQEKIIDMAAHSTLGVVINALREHGVETSVRSLKRYIREHREKNLVEDREKIEGTVEALARRGREGKLREGTLEAVRQQLYEQALASNTPEEALAMYAAMVKEETRLKELELEARKVAALEQQVKLQGLRIEVEMAKARQAPRVKSAEVVESKVVAVGELTNGEKRDGLEPGGPGSGDEEKKRVVLMLREVHEIVNRGGAPEEKVLELRVRLGEEMKGLGPDL